MSFGVHVRTYMFERSVSLVNMYSMYVRKHTRAHLTTVSNKEVVECIVRMYVLISCTCPV